LTEDFFCAKISPSIRKVMPCEFRDLPNVSVFYHLADLLAGFCYGEHELVSGVLGIGEVAGTVW
jgi:hypothetical protein